MKARGRSHSPDIDGVEVVNKDSSVRDAGVHRVDGRFLPIDFEGFVQCEIKGLTELDSNLIIDEFASDDSGDSFKRGFSQRIAFQLVHETGKATGSVAAHLGFTSVRIVIAHAKVSTVLGRLDGEEAISTNATLALADAFDLLLIEGQGVITIVNHDKIVTRTVHFGEFEHRIQ